MIVTGFSTWCKVRRYQNRSQLPNVTLLHFAGVEWSGCHMTSTENAGAGKIIIRIEQNTSTAGTWCAAWLFTIGFLHLDFGRGVLAIILWPYYLDAHFSAMAR